MLQQRDPDHPVAILFNLILEPNREKIIRTARNDYSRIRHADLSETHRAVYGKIFIHWLMQRLRSLTRKEIDIMLDIMAPLKETRAYKDIAEEARDELLEERLGYEINLLRELRDEGSLTEQAYAERVAPLERELTVVRARRAESQEA